MAGKGTRGDHERRPQRVDTLWRHVGGRGVTGIAGVVALVLAEAVAGTAAFTWVSPLWDETKRSYFTLWTALVALLFAWPAWLTTSSGAIPGDAAGTWSVRLTLASAVILTLAFVAFVARLPLAGRIVGIVSVPVAV